MATALAREARKLLQYAQREFQNTLAAKMSTSLEVILIANWADKAFESLSGCGINQTEANRVVNAAVMQAITAKRQSLPTKGKKGK